MSEKYKGDAKKTFNEQQARSFVEATQDPNLSREQKIQVVRKLNEIQADFDKKEQSKEIIE